MEVKIQNIEVRKTARVFTLGTLSSRTKNIWLVFHGYGMLAQYFIKKFDELDFDENFIIAPEALSRFYQAGFTGRIGASWMTSEDRENEIHDYVEYIEEVFQKHINPYRDDRKIIALGFSQGVATLFRWANSKLHKIDKLVAWSGTIPNEVIENYHLSDSQLYIFYGNEDPFLKKERMTQYIEELEENNIMFIINEFDGGHVIVKEKLSTIL